MQNSKENEFASAENKSLVLAIGTDLGDRKEQQDCFGFIENDEESLIVVCDGMGGLDDGKLASTIAVKTMLSNYEQRTPIDNVTDFLLNITKEANKNVYEIQADNNEIYAGSTIVSVIVKNRNLYWASVGDSRAYLYRNGAYIQFTEDHNYKTILETQKKSGEISENEFNKEIDKGEALICHLGLSKLDLIDFNDTPVMLEPEDIIIIMSDGLYKVLTDSEIFTIISNFGNVFDAVNALQIKAKSIAKNRGLLRDNTTIAIIKIK